MTEQELNSRLPIIPHATVADTDCPGCLVVGLHDDQAELLCNECGVIVTSLPSGELESYIQNLLKTMG